MSVLSCLSHLAAGELHAATHAPRRRVVAVIAMLTACSAVLVSPARAVVPPYAEEWAVPTTPQDVEVDPFGRVWVSCSDDSIRVFTATGGGLLFAFGGTGSGDGEFSTPYGMAFDPSGDAYICDYAGARVEKFTSMGGFLLSWPIPSTRADHVAVDAAGDVYVTGYDDFSVHKFNSAGDPLLDWPSNGGSRTSGIVETAGTVHVVQWDLPIVEQFTTEGDFLGWFEAETIGGTDIEVDAVNQLWVCDYSNNVVRIFTTEGVPVDLLGGFGSGPGEFNGAIGAAVGPDGSIYVADELNGRIQRFGETGAGASPEPADLGPRAGGSAIRSIAPNPCRTGAELTFSLPQASPVQLSIVDISGRTVATLAEGRWEAGERRVAWAARDAGEKRLEAGVYWIRLAHGTDVDVARLTVVR